MIFLSLDPGPGATVVASMPRFTSLEVAFSTTGAAHKECPGYGLSARGSVSDELSVHSWRVGGNVYLAQPLDEVDAREGRASVKDGIREKYKYWMVPAGGIRCILLLPPHIGRLDIVSDHGFRLLSPETVSEITIHGLDGAVPDIPIDIRATGVSLNVAAGHVTGTIGNPGRITIAPPPATPVAAFRVAERDWAVPGSVHAYRTPGVVKVSDA